MSSMLEESRKYIPFFYQNGEWMEEPIMKHQGRNMDCEVVDYMRELFELLMESKLLSESTKLYLSSPFVSIRRMVDLHNERSMVFDTLNYGTVTSSIKYDRKKLAKYFSSNCLIGLIEQKEKYIEKMRETLDQLKLKYYKDYEYKEKLKIRIPATGFKRELSEKEWNTLLKILRTYSVNTISKIEQGKVKTYSPLFQYYHFLLPYGWKCYKLKDLVKTCQVKKQKDVGQEYIWVNYPLPDLAKYTISMKEESSL